VDVKARNLSRDIRLAGKGRIYGWTWRNAVVDEKRKDDEGRGTRREEAMDRKCVEVT